MLFIPREQFATNRVRKIANWAAVLDALTDETMRAGVALQSLVFDGLPLAEQVAALRAADIVITQRGSVNANFVVLRPETRVLLLSDPINYDAFYWLGPMWFRHTGVHIQGDNFDPFGVVDVPRGDAARAAQPFDCIQARDRSHRQHWQPLTKYHTGPPF